MCIKLAKFVLGEVQITNKNIISGPTIVYLICDYLSIHELLRICEKLFEANTYSLQRITLSRQHAISPEAELMTIYIQAVFGNCCWVTR